MGPLSGVGDDGAIQRPLTFSRDSLFSGPGEGCSSIDGILLNQPAAAALVSCEVLESFGKQHRPVKCTFSWKALAQVGFVHYKFAPFDLSDIPKQNLPTKAQGHPDAPLPVAPDWDALWDSQFQHSSNPDEKWDLVNQYCIEQMLAIGAKWVSGPRQRAKPPKFVAKTICPAQHRIHCAATRKGSALHKLLARLDELAIRRSRGCRSDQDHFIFCLTHQKITRALLTLKAPVPWVDVSFIMLVHISAARNWVHDAIRTHELQTKTFRIQAWKQKLQQSGKTNKTYIFHHLRNKMHDEPPNLVQDRKYPIPAGACYGYPQF